MGCQDFVRFYNGICTDFTRMSRVSQKSDWVVNPAIEFQSTSYTLNDGRRIKLVRMNKSVEQILPAIFHDSPARPPNFTVAPLVLHL